MHYDSRSSTGLERTGALIQALFRLTVYSFVEPIFCGCSMGMGTYNVMLLLLGGGEYCFNCIVCIYFY